MSSYIFICLFELMETAGINFIVTVVQNFNKNMCISISQRADNNYH